MLYHMPHIATAAQLNSSALPHAPQIDDTPAPSLLLLGLEAVNRAITPFLGKHTR